jgi:glycosyltransferase involved in cell wall biosynthesis
MNRCCICGPVKNCGPYLGRVFENIERIGALFDSYVVILFYDHSDDDTLTRIKEYQRKNDNVTCYVNKTFVSRYRTHRIAYARNYCIDQIKEKYGSYPFFIMMDFDDPNSKTCNPEIIQKYLKRDDWDALSFNTSPAYYDIWALSLYPFCFSYNHFKNNVMYYSIMQRYVTQRLSALSKSIEDNEDGPKLLRCISSFNGFSIYKTKMFLNCKYDGRVNVNLLPTSYMKAHSEATRSPIIYKDYGHVKGRFEDCEHRAFHVEALKLNGAKIMISPEVVFL